MNAEPGTRIHAIAMSDGWLKSADLPTYSELAQHLIKHKLSHNVLKELRQLPRTPQTKVTMSRAEDGRRVARDFLNQMTARLIAEFEAGHITLKGL